jgi:serine/threonine protein kinase
VVGEVLSGKYRIEKLVGKGGFGSVYRALDVNLKRKVGVKVLTAVGDNKEFRQRFIHESEWMAQLKHPNIVTLHDVGEHRGRPYMVMEYVDGRSLWDLVHKATLTPQEVKPLALQICLAMVYAHSKGIVHRDLTLKNIMVEMGETEELVVKILDFGLAKLLHQEAVSTGTSVLGTPWYMSPEQIRGETVDGKTDIFAFGVDLFRMLNGRFPFDSEHPTAVMYLICNEMNVEFEDHVPENMKGVILNCLEKEAGDRPDSFAVLADAFKAMMLEDVSPDSTQRISIAASADSGDRSSKRNPYLNRVMIKSPADFWGRDKEIRKIYSRLDAPHPQSISVVGERRIGKSSLLNYIYSRRNRKTHMQNFDDAIFVYLDFQSRAEFDVPKFINFLFSVFQYESKDELKLPEGEKTLDTLKDVVKELHDAGKRIIVLMDEFESITRNPNFDESFFSFMRALANSYRVAYVTSSRDELQNMCHNKDISDSPFFNIFSNLPLHPFSPGEAAKLIEVPSRTEGVPLEKYKEKIMELAGYFPFFLQIACSTVFEQILEDEGAEPDWDHVNKSYTDEVYPHYGFVWDRMEEPEKENLRRLASGKGISRQYEFVNENLLRRGYLIEKASGALDIFAGSFKDFVLQQTPVEPERKSIFSFFKRRR